MWKSDGTGDGTTLLKDFNVSQSPVLQSLTGLNGTLYFIAPASPSATAPDALWKSDGTAAGTAEVNLPAAAAVGLDSLTAGNGKLYFAAGAAGNEALWESDGTAAGTTPIVSLGNQPVEGNLAAGNGEVYFAQEMSTIQGPPSQGVFALEASEGSHTQQLGANITAAGVDDLTLLNGKLYFLVPVSGAAGQVWEADASAGPAPIAGFAPGISSMADFTAYNGDVYLAGWDANHGVELWQTDGTAAGTALVDDVNPGPASSEPPVNALGGAWSYQMTVSGGKLYFTADDGTHGDELWETDGTAAGTALVDDINPGPQGSDPENLIGVNGTLFFTANDGTDGEQLWALPSAPPLSATGQPITTVEGQTFSGQVATFTDPNPLAPASYTATISWGDGHTWAGTVAALGNSQFSASGSNTYAQTGTYTVSVQIDRAGGGSAAAATTATVASVGSGDLFATTAGQPFSGVVGTFTDHGPSATIHWGDGHVSAGTVAALGNGQFSVSGGNTYANGPAGYPVVVNISLTGGRSAYALSEALVSLSASGPPMKATEGQPFSGVVATFSDPSPAPAGAYASVISWGDGQTSAGTVAALGGGRFAVSGSNTYAHAGTYTVSAQVSRPGGVKAAATTTVSVTDAPFWATRTFQRVGPGQPVTGVLGTLVDRNPLAAAGDFTVTIDWGDGTKSPGLLLPKGNGTFDIAGSHDYTSAGARTLDVAITDEGGRTVTTDPLVTVDS